MAASHVLNGGSPSLFRDTGFAIVPTKSPPGGERLCGTASAQLGQKQLPSGRRHPRCSITPGGASQFCQVRALE